MGEYSSTGALVRRYIPGPGLDEPLMTYDGTGATTKTWLYGDERGSITAAANASGALLAAYTYGPFGEPNVLTGVALRYTGQRLDPESGLSYYRARWYSPYMGRFLSPDPIGLDGGTHLYRYVGNDPINFVDPSGLQKQEPQSDDPCKGNKSINRTMKEAARRGDKLGGAETFFWTGRSTPNGSLKIGTIRTIRIPMLQTHKFWKQYSVMELSLIRRSTITTLMELGYLDRPMSISEI